MKSRWPKEAPVFFDRWRNELVEGVEICEGEPFGGLLKVRHMEDCNTCSSGAGYGFLNPDSARPLTAAAREMLAIARGAR